MLTVKDRLFIERYNFRAWTFARWTAFWLNVALLTLACDFVYAILRRH